MLCYFGFHKYKYTFVKTYSGKIKKIFLKRECLKCKIKEYLNKKQEWIKIK